MGLGQKRGEREGEKLVALRWENLIVIVIKSFLGVGSDPKWKMVTSTLALGVSVYPVVSVQCRTSSK